VCVCLCVCVCVPTCKHVCACTFGSDVYLYSRTHTHTHTHTQTHTNAQTHKHTHTRARTRTHTQTHTCRHKQSWEQQCTLPVYLLVCGTHLPACQICHADDGVGWCMVAQCGDLPVHLAAENQAGPEVMAALLLAYPAAVRMPDHVRCGADLRRCVCSVLMCNVFMHISVCFTYIHVCVDMYVYIYVFQHIHLHPINICAYIYIYMHIY